MDPSTLSMSNTISKGTAFDPDYTDIVPPGEPVSISNEQIRKGDRILATYEVMEEAIHGGMGSVWRVHHSRWNVDLAMKRPQPRFFAEGSAHRKEAFLHECENWINLGLHPNIVSCYYVREIGGVPTVFSEWMENGSLKDRIGDETLYEGTKEEVSERLLDIAIQTARGLRYSHGNQLIHQDVKPGNLLLTKRWEAKVADFGLARARSRMEETAGSGMLSTGYTLSYCPKEQAEGAALQRWMDIYAWALTVLEMYAGRRLWETGAQAKDAFSDYVKACRTELPPALAGMLEHALNKGYDSFEDVLPGLEEIYRTETQNAYPRPDDRNASDTAAILNNRALSWLDLGMTDKALAAWEDALRIDPEHRDSLFNRELFLVRTDQEYDHDAVRTLDRYDPSGALSEPIRLECGGTYSAYSDEEEKSWKEVKVSGSASFFGLSDGCFFLPVFEPPEEEKKYLDPRDNGHSRLVGLKKVRLDGTGEEFLDRMEALDALLYEVKYVGSNGKLANGEDDPGLVVNQGKREIEIHPGKHLAALLQYHVLSLYDYAAGKLLVKQKHILDGDTDTSLVFSPDGTRVVLDVTLGRRDKRYFTLILSVPSLEPVFEAEYRFIGFSKEGLFLRSEQELAHFTEETGIQTIFRFEKKVEAAYEFTGEDEPVFLYRYADGETFALSREETDTDEGGTSAGTAGAAAGCSPGRLHKTVTSAACFDGDGKILYYDAENRLLYRKQKSTGIALWDLAGQKRLCTFVTPNQFTPIWDGEDRVLLFTFTMNSYSEWWMIPLPEQKKDVINADWRLSGIVTSNKRLEEDRRIEALAQEFRCCAGREDIPGAIRVHRTCTEIEGFPQKPCADEMEAWLDVHARRSTVYGAFPGEKMWDLPPLCGEHFEITPLSDGTLAMTEDYIGNSGGIALFGEDGSLTRFIRIEGSRYRDKPFFITRLAVRRDRIYAFTDKLEYSVYDLAGERIASMAGAWPPEKKKEQEMADPFDEEERERRYRERMKEVSYEYYDMDSTGRYLLYSRTDRNPGGRSGTFQKDLLTGKDIFIADRGGLFKLGHYLDDDSIIFLQKGGLLERYTTYGSGICSWRADLSGLDVEAVKMRVSPQRDRILVFAEAKNRAPGRTFVFDKDGRVLHRWEEAQYVCQMFTDGRFLYEPGFHIRDSFTGKVVFQAPIPSVTKEIRIAPDGRKVYVREYDTSQIEARGIATEYRVRYLYEEIPEGEKPPAWRFPRPEDVPQDFPHLYPVITELKAEPCRREQTEEEVSLPPEKGGMMGKIIDFFTRRRT